MIPRSNLKSSILTAFKAMLLLNGAFAEEESILDQAYVTSACDPSWCFDNQSVIGPGFKSWWYDDSDSNGDKSNEIQIDFG